MSKTRREPTIATKHSAATKALLERRARRRPDTEWVVFESWLRGVAKTANEYADQLDPDRSLITERGRVTKYPELVKRLDSIARVAQEAARAAERHIALDL